MNLSQPMYPVSPVGVPLAATNPSASFKKEVKKVLVSVALFFAVYIILIILAGLLAIGCVYAGIFVIINSGHLIGIIAGVGIISTGIMVVIFLVKFIFSVKKYDESGTITIGEAEQPQLFAFIRQLTTETQTQFPKKIVLSPEVNASVFYNDSFWSMIFPVKKNLQIGLGLVNCLTLSEFKAVMAHEFGHFSQRSMKLGSFVYNVNKAIYNMLYENKDYGNFLQKWGNLHFAIGIFVWVTIQIVKGIQKILQCMYSLINKNYMGLSREMEFHADAVAASVSGSSNLISALQKLEISDVCYQTVLQKADDLVGEKTRLQNIYGNHDVVMEAYAQHNGLAVQNRTPLADEDFFKKFQYNKINIKNQWASHPPREERNMHLHQLNILADSDARPAWVIFNNAEELQQKLSDVVYRLVPAEQLHQHMNAVAFKEKYQEDIETYSLPKEYNGYYDDSQMNELNLDMVFGGAEGTVPNKNNFAALFADEWIELIKKQAGDQQDVEILKAITEKRIKVKTFDYDGDKMAKVEAPTLLEQLQATVAHQQKQIQQHEEAIAVFFYNAALANSNEAATTLKEKYTAHFGLKKSLETFINSGRQVLDLLSPLLGGETVSIENAEKMAKGLRAESSTLKPMVKKWLTEGIYRTNVVLQTKIENFVEADYRYFSGTSFFDTELGTINQLVNETPGLLAVAQYKSFKELLLYQLKLVPE
ncbi:MAG: M48 family metallopeptidase [Ferruginibacter sp.]